MSNFMDLQSLGFSVPKRRLGVHAYADLAGLMGYDAFGEGGGPSFPILDAVIAFKNEWSWNDWKGGPWLENLLYWKLGSYTPLSPATLTNAQARWTDLSAASDSGMNSAAATLITMFTSKFNSLIVQSDNLSTLGGALAKWSNDQHRERARLFTNINTLVKQVAATQVPAADLPIAQTAPPPAAQPTQPAVYTAPPPVVNYASSSSASTASGSSGKFLGLPIAVVIPVGLAGLVAALMVVKRLTKKKTVAAPAAAPIAGYRRSKRRR